MQMPAIYYSFVLQPEFICSFLLIVLALTIGRLKAETDVKPTYKFLISIPASLAYFLPFHQLMSLYFSEMKKGKLLNKKYMFNKIKGNISADTYVVKKILASSFKYTPIITLIFAYFFVVKEKKFKVNYFIRHHTMHSILMLFIQFPMVILHKYSSSLFIVNPIIQLLATDASTIALALNGYALLYLLFCAGNNFYASIPFLTAACEAHIGKNVGVKY